MRIRPWLIVAVLLLATAAAMAYEPFVIVPAPGKVVVDGKSGDWDLSGAYGPVTFDSEFLGQTDATFYGMYDDTNLYLLVHANDPTPLINKGIVEEGNYWSGDSIEIRFSLDPKDGVPPVNTSPSIRNMAFWFNSDRQRPQFFLRETMKYNPVPSTGMQVVFRKWDNGMGWDCEAAIPWATLSPTVRPKAGDHVGWCMAVLFGNQAGTGFWRKANVLAGDINYQDTASWFTPGAFFSPTGKVAPNPKTATPPKGGEPVAPPVTKIEYTLPRAGEVSLAVYGADGQLVRTLLCHEAQEAGARQVAWDGYDDDGQPLAPGEYSWKLAVGDGVKATFVTGLLNGGSPTYPSADGKGSWGGVWGNVIDTAADNTGVYLLWVMEEGQGALLKVDTQGRVIWKQHIPQALVGSQCSLASNGEYVVLADTRGLWRVNALTGEYAPFTEKDAYIQMPFSETWKNLKPEERSQRVPELARLESLAGMEQPLCGLAMQGSRIYVSRLLDDKVEVYDMATAGKLGEVAVPKPFGVEVDRGKLYVVSGKQVLRFDAVTLAPEGAAVAAGLEEPYGLAIDRFGSFWVSDLGKAQQVKRFGADGKLIAAFGKEGGRPKEGGKFVKEDFLSPAGLCVEPTTGQVFLGEDVAPKRVVALDSQGRYLREWLGPYYWGAAGFQMDVRHTPLQLYAVGCSGSSIMRFNINLEEGTAELDAVWPTVDFKGPAGQQVLFYYMRQGRLVYHDGKPYLGIAGHDVSFFKVDGYKLVPSAFVATGRFGALESLGLGKPPEYGGGVTWHDENGNGAVDPAEVKMYPKLASPWPAGYWEPSIGRTSNPEDFTLTCAGRDGVFSLSPSSFDGAGNPVFDYANIKTLAAPLPYPATDPLPRLAADGSIYYSRWSYAAPGEQPKGLDWAARITDTGFAKLSPEGKPVWKTLRKAESFRKPDQAYGMQFMEGPYQGCVFGDDCSGGLTYVVDGDGLLLGCLYEDVMRGASPSPYTLYVEHFTSAYFEDPASKQLYAMTGADDIRIFRVSGIDSFQRMAGKVSFTQPPQPRVAPVLVAAKPAPAALFRTAPKIDGDLGEWKNVPRQEMAVGKPGEEGSASFQLGYDAKNLYAALHVVDSSPMVNAGKALDTIWKYGDAINLYLACDPAAKPDRKDPVPGDVRLVLTKYQGKPLVQAYRGKVPGTTHPAVFTSGVGTYTLDVVEVLKDATLAFKVDADGTGYSAELAVPLSDLKPLAPKPGLQIGFDAGIDFSDAAGQFNAARIFWTGREAMVRDVPTEATLFQDRWGKVEFGG